MLHEPPMSLHSSSLELSYKTRHNPSFPRLHMPVGYSNSENSIFWILGPCEKAGFPATWRTPSLPCPAPPPWQVSLKLKVCLTRAHDGAVLFSPISYWVIQLPILSLKGHCGLGWCSSVGRNLMP